MYFYKRNKDLILRNIELLNTKEKKKETNITTY